MAFGWLNLSYVNDRMWRVNNIKVFSNSRILENFGKYTIDKNYKRKDIWLLDDGDHVKNEYSIFQDRKMLIKKIRILCCKMVDTEIMRRQHDNVTVIKH